ncbi:MAG: radical SAM protein [Deltaproteobacteria bacterium]|nr:radical SAM protein [Deltaproteobacteria bacterium]
MGCLEIFRTKKFYAWQIEITTKCAFFCKMCIKAECIDYEKKDMKIEDFKKLVSYFPYVRSVVLEGWGESVLHPHFLDFVSIVKNEGPRVGFVTSGYGLDESYIKELLKLGIDFLGFSFSGAKASTHENIRVNSHFDELIGSIRSFQEHAKTLKLKSPKMHIVYLLLKNNIEDSPFIVDLAKDLGIKEIVFLNIIQISSQAQNEMKVFSYDENTAYDIIIREVQRKASSYGIKVHLPSFTANQELTTCPERPLESLYVSVEGDVSPCVYLNPPVKSPFVRIFKDKIYHIERVKFGNLFSESLDTIWERDEYIAFRDSYLKRELAAKQMFESLFNFRFFNAFNLPHVPEPCRTCHKIYGL